MKKKVALFIGIGVLLVLAVLFSVLLLPKAHSTAVTANPPTATAKAAPGIPAAIPGEVVYIPFPEKITVDGDLSDWKDIPSVTVDTGPTPSKDPAEDGSFTLQLAADTSKLYITMQAADKNIIAGKHGTDFWNEDSMEFFINASDNLNTRTYNPKIFQININAADIGNKDPNALTLTGVNSKGHKISGFVFKTANGWGFEAAVPLDGLVTVKHGAEIGFQAQLNGASVKDRNVKLSWSKADKADQSWNLPILFGRALFYELGRTDIPTPSAVQSMPTAIPSPTPVVVPTLISVNQTGYFPDGEKIATVALASNEDVDWSLTDSAGQVVLTGKTTYKGQDAASGDNVHVIDFSAYKTPGMGYKLSAGGEQSVPFDISESLYSQLTKDAMAYFYNNRSGIPISANYVGAALARSAGHTSDTAVTCYKGTDADGVSWPGCNYTLNVAGGWYDAGDFGKYVVDGGIAEWTLADLYEQFPKAFPDGSLKIPEQSNGVPDLLDEARWEMDFLLSMQVPQGQQLAGMAHHKIHDLTWAAMPMIPPSSVNNNNDFSQAGVGRYLYPPSTAATLNLAATAAQCTRIWKTIDPSYSQRCLTAAETAWKAALAHPALFAGNTPGSGGGNYPDDDVKDEFYWAASELYVTTGKQEYETYLLNSPDFANADTFDWGHTATLGTITLATQANGLPQAKLDQIKQNILTNADGLLAIQSKDGYSTFISGEYVWGSNSVILNDAMIVGVAYKLTQDDKYLESMREAMDYILGHNSLNRSFVSGYGTYSNQHPHHRFWANDPANGYPAPPAGVLAGGPNSNPSDDGGIDDGLSSLPPAKRYLDQLLSFSTNEVAINWNAPLVWVSTYLEQNAK
jgi:Domain of unknown function (DUF1083)./Glycosyl hydrolase family 9./N-terminal ig-like domain of cellulase.